MATSRVGSDDLVNICGFNDITDYTCIYGGSSSTGWGPGDGFSRFDYGATSSLGAYGNQSGILACTWDPAFGEFDNRINPNYT